MIGPVAFLNFPWYVHKSVEQYGRIVWLMRFQKAITGEDWVRAPGPKAVRRASPKAIIIGPCYATVSKSPWPTASLPLPALSAKARCVWKLYPHAFASPPRTRMCSRNCPCDHKADSTSKKSRQSILGIITCGEASNGAACDVAGCS